MDSTELNPYNQGRPKNALMTSAAATDQQRGIAEVQAAMMIARSNPRDEMAATDRILNACCRPSLAMSGLYSYARGGASVTGPSIRLAEAIAQQWGNMQFGVRELDQSNGSSQVLAYAWDVQNNTRKEMLFSVPHIRHTKQGAKTLSDPRDIYELIANNGARRVRACILAIIPGDVIEAAVLQCEKTLSSNADTSPEAIKKMVNAFAAEFDVTQKQIEKRIQRRLEGIQPAHVLSLRKIYTSLKDGMSSVSDWFEPLPADAAPVREAAVESKPIDKSKIIATFAGIGIDENAIKSNLKTVFAIDNLDNITQEQYDYLKKEYKTLKTAHIVDKIEWGGNGTEQDLRAWLSDVMSIVGELIADNETKDEELLKAINFAFEEMQSRFDNLGTGSYDDFRALADDVLNMKATLEA